MEEIQKKRLIFFDSEHAVMFGINSAILINYFQYYIRKNIEGDLSGSRKKQDRSFRAGRTYAYISKENLAEYFPFFTESKVKTALNKLIKNGILVTGSFNKKGYDRTLWYAFKNEEEFLELTDQYRQFLKAQKTDSPPISDINPGTDKLPSNPRNSSLDKKDRWLNNELTNKPMNHTFLSDAMDNSPQSIGQKSPTIPINTILIHNRKENNTYLLDDDSADEINLYNQYLDDSDAEGEFEHELIDGSKTEGEILDEQMEKMELSTNSNKGKVGNESLPAASGSGHNVDNFCSITDIKKLTLIMDEFIGQSEADIKIFGKWHDWVVTKQKDGNEIKHSSAWIKSFLKFLEKNRFYEQAKEQESLRKKKEDEIAKRTKNYNPYNDMMRKE